MTDFDATFLLNLTQVLFAEIGKLKQEAETLKREKNDLEILMESSNVHSDFIIEDIIQELKSTKQDFLKQVDDYTDEVAALRAKLEDLRTEKTDLELMMEMASDHADEIGAELREKAETSEQLFKSVLDLIPVPVVIAEKSGGNILYANSNASQTFGFPHGEFIGQKTPDFYENAADRQRFLEKMAESGSVGNFEARMKKSDDTPFWVALFSKSVTFANEPCVITTLYDLTERKQAEEEIRRLNEALEKERELEGKYLLFTLAGEEYGIDLLKIREIIGMVPLTPVPGMPDFVKGVFNLRGKVIPVADLRTKLGLNVSEYTDRTCIIIVEIEEKSAMIGLIVDFVNEVMGIKGRQIVRSIDFGDDTDTSHILGIAKTGDNVKVILDVNRIFTGADGLFD